jgi:hypothetical protein
MKSDPYYDDRSGRAGLGTWLLVFAALAVAAYFASPYASLYFLREALVAGDAHAIEKRVDFASVRTSLKEQAKLHMLRALAEDKDMQGNPFAGLAAALAPAMIDNLVDASVTADGIAHLINQGKLKGAAAPGASKAPTDPAASVLNQGFAGFDDFEIEFVSGAKAWLRREFPLSWRVYKVQIPMDAKQSS